jgi:C-terminal processing protease CtpA/Prc
MSFISFTRLNFNSLYKYLTGIALITLLLASSCREEDPTPVSPSEPNEHEYVNDWIRENMDFWYYWNNEIPSNPDKTKEPDVFFESLLSSEDRFSWIQDNFVELLNSLQGINKESGYEFVLYRESEGSSNVIAQIVYIKYNSPAEDAGLKRGDIVTHINNQQITTSNYQDLLGAISESHSITYKSLDLISESFGDPTTISLEAVEYAEDPNYLNNIIEINDNKIGYFVYNFFANGPSSSSKQYNDKMDEIFNAFKSSGITDLIIDLRFNSGGSESATVNLASLIGATVNDTKIFAKRQYNDGVTQAILQDPDLGEDFLKTLFTAKSQNVGSQLGGNRVYILTGSRTASASELLINGLTPYMDVFLIGDVTVGKNVGSISLYEENDPNNTWGLQPIVVKTLNSVDQSEYSNGFTPNILDEDNSVILYPLGDPAERLLSRAIEEITGVTSLGRKRTEKFHHELIGSSIDLKRRSFRLVIDTKLPAHLFE